MVTPSLKLVHSTDTVQEPNPVSEGGWHGKVENEAEEFAKLSYRYGFKAYAVVKLNSLFRGSMKPHIKGTNLNPEFLKHIDSDEALGGCSLFQVLSQTCVPFSWKSGVNAYTGRSETDEQSEMDKELDELLLAFDYEGGFCVPVHDPKGNRSVVVFMGPHFDNSARYSKLVVETIELFDAAIRSASENEQLGDVQLTELELSCLDCSINGADLDATALQIGMSRHVVSVVLKSICAKFDAKNVPQAVAKALSFGVIGV